MDGAGVVPAHKSRLVPEKAATQRPSPPRELAPLGPSGGPPPGPTTPRTVHTPKESRKRTDFWPLGASYCRTPESENADDPECDHFHDLAFLDGPANWLDEEALRHRGGLVNQPAMLSGYALHVQRNPETRERAVRMGDLVVWQEPFAVIADVQVGDRVERRQLLLSTDYEQLPGHIVAELFRINGGRLTTYLDGPVWLSGVVAGFKGGASSGDEIASRAATPQAILRNTRWAEQGPEHLGGELVHELEFSGRRHDVHMGILVGLKLVINGHPDDVSTESSEQLRLQSWSFEELLDVLAFTASMGARVSKSAWLASSVWKRDDFLGADGWRQLVHALQVFVEGRSLPPAANLLMKRGQERAWAAFFDQWSEASARDSWIASKLLHVPDVYKFAVCYWKRTMISIEPEQEPRDLKLLGMRNSFDQGGWYDASREANPEGAVMVGGGK